MKQLLEFLPLVLFFTAYQMDGEVISLGSWSHTFDGIFSATAVLMISSVVTWVLASLWEKKNERRLMWMAAAILIFGAATLILRDQRFIQWKPILTGCWQSCFWDLTSLGKPRCCSGYWEDNSPYRRESGRV